MAHRPFRPRPHRGTMKTTLDKDFDALSAALADANPPYTQANTELSNLEAIAKAGSKNNGTKAQIELMYQWYENSGSNAAIALGGVNAMLMNSQALAGSQPGDWPQVLGPYVSWKWGTNSKQWAGLWSIKSMNHGSDLLGWVYMEWANSGYSDTVLQNYLLSPNSVPGEAAAAGYATGLAPPSSGSLAPPFGPPNPDPNPSPSPSHLEEIVLIGLGIGVIVTSLYFIAR